MRREIDMDLGDEVFVKFIGTIDAVKLEDGRRVYKVRASWNKEGTTMSEVAYCYGESLVPVEVGEVGEEITHEA